MTLFLRCKRDPWGSLGPHVGACSGKARVSRASQVPVLVTAFLQGRAVCAGPGPTAVGLQPPVAGVSGLHSPRPRERASLLKPRRPQGSVFRVRAPSPGPRAALEHGPKPPVPPGDAAPSLGWGLAVTPFPPRGGKPPGTLISSGRGLCMGTRSDHGPGQAEHPVLGRW